MGLSLMAQQQLELSGSETVSWAGAPELLLIYWSGNFPLDHWLWAAKLDSACFMLMLIHRC